MPTMASLFWSLLLFLLAVPALGEDQVVVITDKNSGLLQEGEWLIEFYAPWCPACQGFEATWEAFADTCKERFPKLRVAKVDVTQETILSGRFLIQRLPTIYHAKDNEFRQFLGDRSATSLEAYIREEKWRLADPYPWYSSPMGPVSAVLGYAMLSGNYLQQLYNYLTVDQGLPQWVVIACGIVGVITLGVSLGLIVVVITLHFSKADRDDFSPAGDEDFGSTGENDEVDKRRSSSGSDRSSPVDEKDKDEPSASSKSDVKASPQSSPTPASKDGSPGRKSGPRQRKKIKASTD